MSLTRVTPRFSYCGLTVVLSKPSRFDKATLLSANGGYFFNEKCLRPEFNVGQIDIRTKEEKSPLLPGTKCVLLLGETAAADWLQNTDNTLNQIRGSVYSYAGVPAIPSYFPQDCVDIMDWEGDDDDEEEDWGDQDKEKSRHGATKRSNFCFWLKKDVEKAKYIMKHGVPQRDIEPNYIIYPSAERVIDDLTNTSSRHLYIDIETDKATNILCFSYSFGLPDICVVPCLMPDYSWAYSALHHIYRAIAVSFSQNTVVAHNGAGFDFYVFAKKYRIAIKKVYDTMLAQHRCYPRVEKSLGHCTSLWTFEPFHKDEGGGGYGNLEAANRMWRYCGKDVYTMILIKQAIDAHAKRTPGLQESIDAANNAVRPYLTTILQGIQYQEDLRTSIIQENDELMMQYLRMIDILVGPENLKQIRGKGKSSMPGSSTQCCRYFHDMLGYPVIAYGKPNKDGIRKPSLGKKSMFKLRLKYINPVIDIILAYRELAKESGALKFKPWIEPHETTTNTTGSRESGLLGLREVFDEAGRGHFEDSDSREV